MHKDRVFHDNFDGPNLGPPTLDYKVGGHERNDAFKMDLPNGSID